MKKITRRLLSALLSVCMIFSLCASSAFAEDEQIVSDYPHFDEYTVLGDSNAAGYGLAEYSQSASAAGSSLADDVLIGSSYPAAVARAVGAQKVNLQAHSAWRTTDFLRAVGYEGFSFTSEPASPYREYIADRSWVKNGQLFLTAFGVTRFNEGTLRAQLHDSIAAADLISVQFGSNDIFTYMLMALTEKWGDIFSDMSSAGSLSGALNVLVNNGKECPEDQKALLIADVINACNAGLKMFMDNYPKVLDYITDTNPNATVVVLGVMNPMEDMLNISKLIDFDIFTLSDFSCAKANSFLYSLCQRYKNCIYVSTTDCDGYGLPALDFDKILNGKNLEPVFEAIRAFHPSETGQAQIAERFLDQLCAKMTRPAVKASVGSLNNIKLEWNKVPGAVSYRVYRSTRANGPYLLVNATSDRSFTDLATLPNVTYYYKVTAVMNLWGTVRTAPGTASISRQSIFKGLKK